MIKAHIDAHASNHRGALKIILNYRWEPDADVDLDTSSQMNSQGMPTGQVSVDSDTSKSQYPPCEPANIGVNIRRQSTIRSLTNQDTSITDKAGTAFNTC